MDQGDDYYGRVQTGYDGPFGVGMEDYKTCTEYAKAKFQAREQSMAQADDLDDPNPFEGYVAPDRDDDDDEYTEAGFIKMYSSVISCQRPYVGSGSGSGKAAVEYIGNRCFGADTNAGNSGASFTGSSMAALFGLLCITLTLW